MTKKGIQNASIEQVQHDHETQSAFKVDNPKKQNTKNKK
ncbi:biofilm-forming protein [Halalkalibacter urbisdiaboli]|nr:biofilm-forming protein [Halalkalibacter urbisdiaboli]